MYTVYVQESDGTHVEIPCLTLRGAQFTAEVHRDRQRSALGPSDYYTKDNLVLLLDPNDNILAF